MIINIKKKTILLTAILLLAISGFVSAEDKIIELNFSQPPDSIPDISRTLQSLTKIQGPGGVHLNGLYLLTHYGDCEEIFQIENQEAIDNPLIDNTWRYCSVFSSATENSVIMGRNWDNENVGSIIVNFYQPAKGYSSISFSRAIDMGYPLNLDLEQIKSTELGNKLLLAPFYAFDGINEHGLAVSVAGVKQVTVTPGSNKELVYVPFLVRKILDQTKNIDEAVNLVEKYIPFDLDKSSLNTHYFIVDVSGRSVILEYAEDQWQKTYTEKPWQVLTNKPIYDVADADLRNKCWRYRSISESLEDKATMVDFKAGMKILQDVSQKGTAWSVVYSPTTKDLYFSVYQKWDTVYHLRLPR